MLNFHLLFCAAVLRELARATYRKTVALDPDVQLGSVEWQHSMAGTKEKTDEQRLLRYLLDGYEAAVRPVRNASDTVVVKLGLTLTQLFDMDEKSQVLTLNVWIDQEWNDELLRWNPQDFGGIKSLRIPCDLIWTPDIVLYNSADDYTEYMRSRAMVFSDGTVFWPPPARLRSTCKITVTFFPFDSQHCSLKFGSWTYHGHQVDITNRSQNVDLSYYVESGEFDLVSVHQVRRVVKYTCSKSLGDEPYPDLMFYIHIRRKTLYYMHNIVVPCLMMSTLTLLVFFLPPESGEKIALGVTVLLAFSVFMLAIAEKMPETSDNCPLISLYLNAVMAITSVSVIMTVTVLNFHHRGPFHHPVPEWVRHLVLVRLKRLLRMELSYPANDDFSNNNGIISKLMDQFSANKTFVHPLINHSNGTCENGNVPTHYQSINVQPTPPNIDRSESDVGRRKKKPPNEVQLRLLKVLESINRRQEFKDRKQRMTNEWRQVAQVIDRLLFWIFLVTTLGITVMLLIAIPYIHRATESSELDESLYSLH